MGTAEIERKKDELLREKLNLLEVEAILRMAHEATDFLDRHGYLNKAYLAFRDSRLRDQGLNFNTLAEVWGFRLNDIRNAKQLANLTFEAIDILTDTKAFTEQNLLHVSTLAQCIEQRDRARWLVAEAEKEVVKQPGIPWADIKKSRKSTRSILLKLTKKFDRVIEELQETRAAVTRDLVDLNEAVTALAAKYFDALALSKSQVSTSDSLGERTDPVLNTGFTVDDLSATPHPALVDLEQKLKNLSNGVVKDLKDQLSDSTVTLIPKAKPDEVGWSITAICEELKGEGYNIARESRDAAKAFAIKLKILGDPSYGWSNKAADQAHLLTDNWRWNAQGRTIIRSWMMNYCEVKTQLKNGKVKKYEQDAREIVLSQIRPVGKGERVKLSLPVKRPHRHIGLDRPLRH